MCLILLIKRTVFYTDYMRQNIPCLHVRLGCGELFNWNFFCKYILLSSFVGKGKDYWEEENINEEMPACRQMFNIFHPFDPVAYR